MQIGSRFGIYINVDEKKVVRINSPYWMPEEPQWVYLTPEINATLVRIRELALTDRLVEEADDLVWEALPSKE